MSREQLAAVLRAVTVTSSTSFTWFGRPSRPLPPDLRAAVHPSAARAYLVEALQRELYRSFYIAGRPVPASGERLAPARPDEAFVDALSQANAGAGGWQLGWRIESVQPGSATLTRDGLTVRACVSDYTEDRVRRPKELRAASPGFYTALGDRRPAEADEVRMYFHVSAAGAAPLVAACTRLLNHAEVPFALKVADSPAGFHRCDAAVLYLERGAFHGARRMLANMASACAPHLRVAVPAFTKALTRGVAVGEHHPSLGASFGAGRCRLVAESLVEAHERRAGRLDERVDAVARRFADHGLDVDAPHLAPGSATDYAL